VEIMAPEAETRIRFNIAQIYASQSMWKETIGALNEWVRWVEEPTPLSYYLLGIAYFQLGEIDSSIGFTEKAVDLSPKPAEGWLQLLAALYIQKEDYANAAPVFEELLVRFPKKAYWVQLSLIYGAEDNYTGSLAVQQVAHLQGFLVQDSELRRLARSYLYLDLPHPAAQILESGLADGTIAEDVKAYELLANSWIAAREFEKSIPPLIRAAELSPDGNLFVRLGQVYLQRENFGESAKALERALDRGGLKKPGGTQLLLGIVFYNMNEAEQARASFARASKDEASRAQAERWMTHLDNEAGSEGQESADAGQTEAG
jgi:tetratricopeptide (TPR) repeat protein